MISNILEKLENTNSQNEKIKILETLNDTQKEWFRMCYNPRITFGIKKIPSIPENQSKEIEYNIETTNTKLIKLKETLN